MKLRAVSLAGNVLFGLVSVLVVGLLAGLTVLPPFLHYGTYVVLSGSMSPTIPTGSVVVAAATAPEQLKVGDVITFVRPGDHENVTHRIVEIKPSQEGPVFVTKGDANGVTDATEVRYASTAGKVVFSIPFVGYALKAIGSPTARLILIIVPGFLLLAMWLWEIWAPRPDLRRRDSEVPPNLRPGPSTGDLFPSEAQSAVQRDVSPEQAATLPLRQ